jgi:hypothetical protein
VSGVRSTEPVPNTLREHRQRHGLEQWQVAEGLAALTDKEIGLDAQAVSRHERGLHRPQRRYRTLYSQFYNVTEAELWPRTPLLLGRSAEQTGSADADRDSALAAAWDPGGTVEAALAAAGGGGLVERRTFLFLTGTAVTVPAHQWLVHEPGPLTAALHGDRVTPPLADRLPPMIAELRRMDDAHSPGVVLALAERDFTWVTGLLDQGSYDEATGRRLHVALAELAQVAGSLAYDLGDHGRAQRFYVTGLHAAHTAGDRALGAHILKCMAEQSADLGHPHDALMLVDSALASTRGTTATPAQAALLHSWRARAQAALGDESACTASISAAQRYADQIDQSAAPPWLYWLSPALVMTKTGEALLEAGRPERAEQFLTRGIGALGVYPHIGDQQVLLTRLATAQLQNGKLNEAAASGNRALDLTRQRSSQRSAARIRDLCRRMTQHSNVPVVTEFLERAQDLVA